MTGKYHGERKKKGKGGRSRYRDNDEFEDLHGLQGDPKDNDGDRGDHDNDWDYMKEKEQENQDNAVIDITAAQFFGMPDEAFLIKKNKKTEEKKGND